MSSDRGGQQNRSNLKYNTVESSIELGPKKVITERRLLWKIDLCLLPLLLLCYTLQYLDKGSLAFSSLLGIIKDNNLVGQQYSWTNSIFFFGYLVFSYPTSVLIVKFPIGKYVATTVIVWSVILMLHAACHNFSGLMAVRFFLGVGEATVTPAMALLISTFYKREEQALRQCAFFVGDGIAGITGGLIAYAVGHINGKLAAWKYLFLIYGAVTIFWGVVLFFTLPDSPSTARFLTPEERVLAAQRVAKEGSKKTGDYKKYQVIEAFKDPQAWLLVAHTFCVNIATGGLSGFGNLLIQGFGFTIFQSILLTIPGAVSQIIFMGIGAYLGTYVKNARLYAMIFFMIISITGTVMMWKIPAEHKVARMAGACLTAAFSANLPMSLSMVTSNIVGFTKKSTVISMVFVAYCVGRIIGPQFFRQNEAPHYETGLKAILSVFSLAAFFAIVLRAYLMWENAKRDKEAAAIGVSPNTERDPINSVEEEQDLTDWGLKNFRYLF